MTDQLIFDFAVVPSEGNLRLLTAADIFARVSASLLEALKEDRRLERKPASFAPRALGDYLCMWANTPGGGLMVLGQEDDGRFTGCSQLTTRRINAIERAGDVYCPDAR